MARPPRYLRPTAEAAGRAIVTGDPGRALALAQELIATPPPMFNHHRGLWGYCGRSAADGEPLLVQGTGLGGASARAVTDDLADLGVRVMLRLGSCSSAGALEPGRIVIVDEATAESAAGAPPLRPDQHINSSLAAALGDRAIEATVQSSEQGRIERSGRADVSDLATYGLLATAAERGVRASALLVVARDCDSELPDGELEEIFRSVAAVAATALGD